MNRNDVTEKIISTKVAKGLQWEAIAKKVGQSKEWTTALCLGQMTATPEQAKIVGKIFGLTAEEQKWLQVVPYKGSLPTPVPTDPITSPCTRKIRRTDREANPIALRMPISRVLSFTTMVSVLTMLNAATSTMSSRITRIASFSSLSAWKSCEFTSCQSSTRYG